MKNDVETKFIKEPENETKHYIFQRNRITTFGFYLIIAILALIFIGLYLSGNLLD